MKKNIFLTGPPSAGKTTVIKKVIAESGFWFNGFFTEEVKLNGKRAGFLMKTCDGSSAYLAHQDIKSDYTIRRYGVSITNIETLAVPSIKPRDNSIIILDEIGKMECFSDLFQDAALEALNSENIVIGTITYGGGDYIQAVKKRDDILIIEVTLENRNNLPAEIIRMILNLKKPA